MKIFISSALILLSSFIYSQNLTLPQLLELKKKDLGGAEEFLTAKGWEFYEASEPDDTSMGKAAFTYSKDEMSSRAESFLSFYYSNYSSKTRIGIQINKKAKYNEYLNAIKGFGCKMISSKVVDGSIQKIYRGATTTFNITASTSTNFYNEETAVWYLFILTNEDYDLNFANE